MKKWQVEGRIRADITFEETVEASTEDAACNKVEKLICKRCGIDKFDILDTEFYASRIKE